MKRTFLIVAGEASGDLHGAALIKSMKNIHPDSEFIGIGGDNMIAEGLKDIVHIRDMAFLGFWEIIKHLPFIRKVKKKILSVVKTKDIIEVILIDYPGFNLSIAKQLRLSGAKIYYYISPQLWAWGKSRVKKIKKLVDKMLVIFPFEKEFYNSFGINAEYVGHPLVTRIEEYQPMAESEFREVYNIPQEKNILLLMPGSRRQEIISILPKIIDAAIELSIDFNLQIVVACANDIDRNLISNICKSDSVLFIKDKTYELLKYSKFGIIKSGTSTLEAALMGLPFITVYRTSIITYLIIKKLIQIDKISIVNIIANKFLIKELIQNNVTQKNIYESVSLILNDKKIYSSLKKDLNQIKNILGNEDASENAAKLIYSFNN